MSPSSRSVFYETGADHCCRIALLADPPGPNPRLPVLTATATAWSAGCGGTGIGAEDGDGTIEIGMMSREILPRLARGAGPAPWPPPWRGFFLQSGDDTPRSAM